MRGPVACAMFIAAVCCATVRIPAATVGSVHGTVTDASDRRPVAGATIELVSPSASYAATTDASGFYSIVGVIPDTYSLTVRANAYQTFAEYGVTITQDSNLAISPALAPVTLKEIVHVATRSGSFPVQPRQPIDVYEVTPRQQAQLGGLPSFDNESMLLNSLPGVTPVAGSAGGGLQGNPQGTSIRGGLGNQVGYQIDGIDATDPLTGYFINNSIVNGARAFNVTAGPGDASKGGSGEGYVNIVTQTGTYPAEGFAQFEIGGPAYEHNFNFQYGAATPDNKYSLFLSGRYGRDFGGGSAPPYGNTYGGAGGAFPDTIGQDQFEYTNDTVANGLMRFGKNNENTLQLWGEWGANREMGGYGLNPLTYPFYTGNPAYQSIYQETPLLLQVEQSRFGIPFAVASPAPLSTAQAKALMPFFPGQSGVDQAIGVVPNEISQYNLEKIAYSRTLGSHAFVNARLYRTQNDVTDNFNDPDNNLFGYGLPAIGFSDNFVTRFSQNTGFASDLQYVLGRSHILNGGFDYRFSRANLQGYVVSPTLFFAGPTIADFLPQDPYTGKPGAFAGDRYPAFNEVIDNDMYRTSVYGTDNWSPTDSILMQIGARYDKQLVPTSSGTYEANALQPRAYGTWTLGRKRDTVLRAGYGHAATFAPLFQLVANYNPPAYYSRYPATLSICGGPAANFHGPCANYYDELQNAWWNGYGVNPVSFSRPQQSDNFDFSIEHAFPHDVGVKFTIFTRHDYGMIVNSQSVTIEPNGAVIPGTTSVTNQGRAETTGAELQLMRQIAPGLSALFNATYVNQFVNYVTSNAFRPSVQPALLASGAMFHPSYLSPFVATASLDWEFHGWRINPIAHYENGYPIGIWTEQPIYLNGVPIFVPNTNLYGGGVSPTGTGTQYCYYTDPQTPGTPSHPHIIGATGGACSPNLNGAYTHPAIFWNVAISRLVTKRVEIGLEVQNVLANYANYPYYNPGYVNNGYGAFGPGSGNNPVFGLPGAVRAYPPGPYFAIPSGWGRQITLYSRIGL
ncbi:MAG: TonB-dependent receptor [Candidatus Eremiobacteraeota bacterium]|nr:TonB-dependent receptor [Candidatus Eremiobacteraeota bacterium]